MQEKRKIPVRGELAVIVIAIINSFSVFLTVYSLGGTAPISSVPYILSEVFPKLSLGVWTYGFQSSLVFILIFARLRRREGRYVPVYLCSFLVGGLFSIMMDVHKAWITLLPQTIPLCILYYVVGYFVLAFGIALSNYCKMPVIPTDLFPREMTVLTGKPYKNIKVPFDVLCLTVTVVLGLVFLRELRGIGIGTVVCAFTMGRTAAWIGNWLDAHFVFSSFVEKYLERKNTSAES